MEVGKRQGLTPGRKSEVHQQLDGTCQVDTKGTRIPGGQNLGIQKVGLGNGDTEKCPMVSMPSSTVKRALHWCVDKHSSQLKKLMCQQQHLLYLLGSQRHFNSTIVVFTQGLNKHLIIKMITSICIKIRFYQKKKKCFYITQSFLGSLF